MNKLNNTKWLAVYVLVAIFITVSCFQNKFESYSLLKGTTFYKLHSLGEDTLKPIINDFIVARIEYRTEDDSLFHTISPKVQVEKPEYPGAIDDCFMSMAVGDSASFLLDADLFFKKSLQMNTPSFFSEGGKIRITVKLLDLQTYADFERQKKEFLSWISDFRDYERIQLSRFMNADTMPFERIANGLYKVTLNKGNGVKVSAGDTVSLHYEGKFLNGKYFDSTKKNRKAFSFVYGREWQLIKGLENAVGMMEEGERSVFILQSDMAFGAEGSSTGIIPPYTSLIYEVELLKLGKIKL